MYSPSARLTELISSYLGDFFESVEKDHLQVRACACIGSRRMDKGRRQMSCVLRLDLRVWYVVSLTPQPCR